jgi:hypothetical protein
MVIGQALGEEAASPTLDDGKTPHYISTPSQHRLSALPSITPLLQPKISNRSTR